MKRQMLFVIAVALLMLSGCRNGPWWGRGAPCHGGLVAPGCSASSSQFDPYQGQAQLGGIGGFDDGYEYGAAGVADAGCVNCQPEYYGDVVDGGGFVPRNGAIMPGEIQGLPGDPASLPPVLPGAPAPAPAPRPNP